MNTIITVEEFKEFYPSSSLTDMQIQLYCEMMTEYIHELAGVSLEEGEYTETLKGNGQDTLYLKKRPVTSINSLEGNRTSFDDVMVNEYKNGIKRLYGVFYKGQDIFENTASMTSKSEIVKVTYTGGYKYGAEGNVPTSLKYALAGMIQSYVDETTGEGKLKAYSRDDVSYTFKDSIERNQSFIAIIGRYI